MPDTIDLTGDGSDEEQAISESESEAPGTPPVLDQHAEAQLSAAIQSVPEARLRFIVKSLSDKIPELKEAMLQELVTSKKRKDAPDVEIMPRWVTCVNCEEHFDNSTRRLADECSYHTGVSCRLLMRALLMRL